MHDLPFAMAALLLDLDEGVTGDPLRGQLCQARGCHRRFSYLLQHPHFACQRTR